MSGTPETPQTLIGAAESLVKATAVAVGVAAAMGLPAVNIQYARYSVPTTLITYEEILRAGILPTITLVILAAYLYWVRAESRTFTPNRRAPALLQLVVWPILLPVALLVAVGGLAMGVLWGWGVLWVLSRPLGYFQISLSNRDLLIGAGPLVLVLIALAVWLEARDTTGTTPRADASSPDTQKSEADEKPTPPIIVMWRRWGRFVKVAAVAAGFLVFVLALTMSALAARLVAYLWNPGSRHHVVPAVTVFSISTKRRLSHAFTVRGAVATAS